MVCKKLVRVILICNMLRMWSSCPLCFWNSTTHLLPIDSKRFLFHRASSEGDTTSVPVDRMLRPRIGMERSQTTELNTKPITNHISIKRPSITSEHPVSWYVSSSYKVGYVLMRNVALNFFFLGTYTYLLFPNVYTRRCRREDFPKFKLECPLRICVSNVGKRRITYV